MLVIWKLRRFQRRLICEARLRKKQCADKLEAVKSAMTAQLVQKENERATAVAQLNRKNSDASRVLENLAMFSAGVRSKIPFDNGGVWTDMAKIISATRWDLSITEASLEPWTASIRSPYSSNAWDKSCGERPTLALSMQLYEAIYKKTYESSPTKVCSLISELIRRIPSCVDVLTVRVLMEGILLFKDNLPQTPCPKLAFLAMTIAQLADTIRRRFEGVFPSASNDFMEVFSKLKTYVETCSPFIGALFNALRATSGPSGLAGLKSAFQEKAIEQGEYLFITEHDCL